MSTVKTNVESKYDTTIRVIKNGVVVEEEKDNEQRNDN